MKTGIRKSSAVETLHRRYIGNDESRKASIQAERINVQVAQKIYDVRKEAGLSQKALADLVGTTQSVISRLENADYEGHSLSMLSRIADALGRKIVIQMPTKDWEADHIKPQSKDGSDATKNLQALNTTVSRNKGDSLQKKSRHSK